MSNPHRNHQLDLVHASCQSLGQPDEHDLGLVHDLQVMQRRRALTWLAGVGAASLLGCGGGGSAASTDSSSSSSSSGSDGSGGSSGSGTSGSCSVIPEETAGPYPGDGSNTANGSIANVLGVSGIVRSDIRPSLPASLGTAAGVTLTVTLTLVDTNASCADLSGHAIYLWHCDREGRYSMYSSGVTDQNYLRGVQETDANGQVTFTTVFPGCYSGRMPHIHFEVYRSLATATSSTSKIKTSQIAFPVADCSTIYSTASGYSASVTNLNQMSFATDNVFSDGTTLQMATLTGSVAAGYTAALTVGIAA
ncbi:MULTISPECIES: intradiol ring-cleavage dioxygenase [unclassified Rhizobacter]|uniref:dioxygenase family protein n=1 Tax=unclassified Rhizobacter TaxID=2640088 RepID=UPI000AEE0D8E|nr:MULTISPECIES: intradiol ring-cleavage dioxygenase [unclassified Rhizobacter]